MNILISNTPKDSINFNNQQSVNERSFDDDDEKEEKIPRFQRSFGSSKRNHSNQKSILKFALYPLTYKKQAAKIKDIIMMMMMMNKIKLFIVVFILSE